MKIIAFFALIISVYGLGPDDVCRPVQYANPDVRNKPELIVAQNLAQPQNDHHYWFGICKLGKNDFMGQLMAHPSSFLDNKFEYDSESRALYKGSFSEIQKISLDTKKESTLFDLSGINPFGSNGAINSIAYDWVTKNLYVVHEGWIKLLKVRDTSESPKPLRALDEKHFNPVIKVFPNQGYLVVKTSATTITRFEQDGSNPKILYNNQTVRIDEIALDYFKQDVYWIETSNGKKSIRYTNLNGGAVKTFEVKASPSNRYNNEHLAVDQNYVYYVVKLSKSDNHQHLLRADKSSGIWDKDFDVTESHALFKNGKFDSILVLSGLPQQTAENHPCKNNNGGCDVYCVAVPDANKKLIKKCIGSGGFISKIVKWVKN